jgi:hypothetical protein
VLASQTCGLLAAVLLRRSRWAVATPRTGLVLDASGSKLMVSRPYDTRYHGRMTHAMTVRLDDDTQAKLDDLAERLAGAAGRSEAVRIAIVRTWQELEDERLAGQYAAVVAENPHYPYESAEEAEAMRERRRKRMASY